jgi:hypothetical protein
MLSFINLLLLEIEYSKCPIHGLSSPTASGSIAVRFTGRHQNDKHKADI